MGNKRIEDKVVKNILDITEMIKEIEKMLLVDRLKKIKIKQVIWLPDNTWVWYNWN